MTILINHSDLSSAAEPERDDVQTRAAMWSLILLSRCAPPKVNHMVETAISGIIAAVS